MSKTRKNTNKGGGRDRHISVRAIRRDPPDYRKLSRALIQLAMAEAEAEAQAQADASKEPTKKTPHDEANHESA